MNVRMKIELLGPGVQDTEETDLGKFVDALQRAFQKGELRFPENLKLLSQPKIFAAWLRPLYQQDWVVYLKPPFGGPEYVLQYLGRYTHRVAISNHRDRKSVV